MNLVYGTRTAYSHKPGTNRLNGITTAGTTTTVGSTQTGNLATMKTGGVTTETLLYNQANQLASAQTTSTFASYAYDLTGQRLEKSQPGVNPILYQFNRTGGELLSENDLHSGTTADYIYLDPGRNSQPIGEVNPTTGKLYFTHTDKLGTPQALTDSTQSVAWSATYQPFGSTVQFNGPLATQSLRLPGQQFDAETGYNHNGFRNYAGNLTRFVESDPIGLNGGMNTYQYANGNAFKWKDRLGLQETAEAGAPYPGTLSGTPPGIPESINQRYGDASALPEYLRNTTELQQDLFDLRAMSNELAQARAQAVQNDMLQQIAAAKVCTAQNPTGAQRPPNTPMLCGPNGCGASILQEYNAVTPPIPNILPDNPFFTKPKL